MTFCLKMLLFIYKNKGYAHIQFETPEAQQKAIEQTNNFKINNRTLRIEYSKGKKRSFNRSHSSRK